MPNSGEGVRSILTSVYLLHERNTRNRDLNQTSPKVKKQARNCCEQQPLCFKLCFFAYLLENFLAGYFMWLPQAGAQEGPDACSRSDLGKEIIRHTKVLLQPYLFLRRARLLPCFRFRIFSKVNETNSMSLEVFPFSP